MLTPSRNLERGTTCLTVHPFRLGHNRLGAQLRNDRVEVLEIVDLEINRDVGEIRRPPGHSNIVDIAVVFGNDLCGRFS